MEREEGYYWVKTQTGWLIMDWSAHNKTFLLDGHRFPGRFPNASIEEIDETPIPAPSHRRTELKGCKPVFEVLIWDAENTITLGTSTTVLDLRGTSVTPEMVCGAVRDALTVLFATKPGAPDDCAVDYEALGAFIDAAQASMRESIDKVMTEHLDAILHNNTDTTIRVKKGTLVGIDPATGLAKQIPVVQTKNVDL